MGETDKRRTDDYPETDDAPVHVKLERQARAIEILSEKDESFWAQTLAYRGDSEA